jgi:hypothetical protein
VSFRREDPSRSASLAAVTLTMLGIGLKADANLNGDSGKARTQKDLDACPAA